jgi:uncharacterized protein (DUF983 family)
MTTIRSNPGHGITHALRRFGRAFLVRCPNCGSGGILASWFRVRDRCPRCGLRLERGEHDHFLGAMMFNIVLAEAVFIMGFVTVLLATWPSPPWDLLEYGGVMAMIAAPIVLYPLSRSIWLAFDLLLRPPAPEEFE